MTLREMFAVLFPKRADKCIAAFLADLVILVAIAVVEAGFLHRLSPELGGVRVRKVDLF